MLHGGCGDQDAMEYAECEAVVKEYPPFVEAMKKRGIEDMDLVMVDPWYVTALGSVMVLVGLLWRFLRMLMLMCRC